MNSEKLVNTKRRKHSGSQISLGIDRPIEMVSRPTSTYSRTAWEENDVTDDVDFSPRTAVTTVDVPPTGMEAEPVAHQKQVPTDVRAGLQRRHVPVGFWTRLKRIVRSKFYHLA